MTNKQLSGWRKALGIAGIVAGSLIPSLSLGADATEGDKTGTPTIPCSVRTRLEATDGRDSGNNKYSNWQTTLGITDCRIPQIGELARWYHNESERELKGEKVHTDFDAAGMKMPWPILGREGTISIFGVSGDKDGVGSELQYNVGPTVLTLNLEKASKPFDAQRVGGEVDWNVNKTLSLGAGFDNIKTDTENTNFYLVRAEFFPGEKDRIGVAFREAQSDVNGNTHTALVDYTHSGKSEKIGMRGFGMASHNDKTGFTSFSGSAIVAQNPTFTIRQKNAMCSYFDSVSWLEGRGNGDMFDVPVVNQSVTFGERVPLNYRSRCGLVGQLDAGYTDKSDARNDESWNFGVTGGYTFNMQDIAGVKFKPGVIGFDKYNKSSLDSGCHTAGAGFLVDATNFLGGNLTLEATVKKGLSGSNNKAGEGYVSVGYSRQF